MADAAFEHPRLAAMYDALDGARDDLLPYAAVAEELGARSVLDVGCGTGPFAVLLAGRGLDVTGVDPAAAMLAVARCRPGAERVRWVHGDATALPPLAVDLATMTGNVAQAIADPPGWAATLRAVRDAVQPSGWIVLESRDPARRAWEGWTRASSLRTVDVPGVGAVETWFDLLAVDGPLVTFRWTYVFASDGAVLTSDSTLRFRERDELAADLAAHGFAVADVRDAPDRPGREFVVLARRS